MLCCSASPLALIMLILVIFAIFFFYFAGETAVGQLIRSVGKQFIKKRTLAILARVELELVAILLERVQEQSIWK